MNKNGQVLVFFVILLPMLIVAAAYVIDMSYGYYHSNKLNNLNKMVIKYGLDHISEADVKNKMVDLIYKNDSSIDTYEISINNGKISINIKKTIDSIFGKAINIDYYYLSSTYSGYIKNGTKIIEKG
jgi:hypothetical protein